MGKVQDLSSVLTGLYAQPLLGPKPDQLLIFKRPQLALKLQGLLQQLKTQLQHFQPGHDCNV